VQRFEIGDVFFDAENMVDDVLVDPELPPAFDWNENDERPANERKWWCRPYVVSRRDQSSGFLEDFPDGVKYDVYCLDGKSSHAPSKLGTFRSQAEAIECAKSSMQNQDDRPEWPGRKGDSPPRLVLSIKPQQSSPSGLIFRKTTTSGLHVDRSNSPRIQFHINDTPEGQTAAETTSLATEVEWDKFFELLRKATNETVEAISSSDLQEAQLVEHFNKAVWVLDKLSKQTVLETALSDALNRPAEASRAKEALVKLETLIDFLKEEASLLSAHGISQKSITFLLEDTHELQRAIEDYVANPNSIRIALKHLAEEANRVRDELKGIEKENKKVEKLKGFLVRFTWIVGGLILSGLNMKMVDDADSKAMSLTIGGTLLSKLTG
jgi:hypothetical protein